MNLPSMRIKNKELLSLMETIDQLIDLLAAGPGQTVHLTRAQFKLFQNEAKTNQTFKQSDWCSGQYRGISFELTEL